MSKFQFLMPGKRAFLRFASKAEVCVSGTEGPFPVPGHSSACQLGPCVQNQGVPRAAVGSRAAALSSELLVLLTTFQKASVVQSLTEITIYLVLYFSDMMGLTEMFGT